MMHPTRAGASRPAFVVAAVVASLLLATSAASANKVRAGRRELTARAETLRAKLVAKRSAIETGAARHTSVEAGFWGGILLTLGVNVGITKATTAGKHQLRLVGSIAGTGSSSWGLVGRAGFFRSPTAFANGQESREVVGGALGVGAERHR